MLIAMVVSGSPVFDLHQHQRRRRKQLPHAAGCYCCLTAIKRLSRPRICETAFPFILNCHIKHTNTASPLITGEQHLGGRCSGSTQQRASNPAGSTAAACGG
ncbi:hypothetical protein ABPG77_010616 [Micractinium sp. CCAP 211/92]